MFWNKYPYTDFSQINLDWLVGKLRELLEKYGKVKTVAGVQPNAAGDIPAAQLKAALDVQPGGDGGIFNVTVSITSISENDYLIMDKTWAEIQAAVLAGKFIHITWKQSLDDDWISFQFLLDMAAGDEYYTCLVMKDAENGVETIVYYADTASDYPCTYHSSPK